MSQVESVPLAPGDLRVTVLPPSYTGRRPESHRNPVEIEALEGSRIRFDSVVDTGRIQLVEAGHDPVPFTVNGDRWTHEFTAASSRILLVRWLDAAKGEPSDRLLHVRVDADRRPVVRIVAPAKDLIFGVPTGQVAVEIEARDDLGLASVALRYTRVTGSGETFTFEEGDIPVQIAHASDGDWRARATLSLDAYRLADGDALVYRALASDRKPGADASASESFLIEIGRLAGAASTGFAIPDERDRQAISQQMLIIKTERLRAERPEIPREAFEEQSRLLAAEQRMVKAEFVFMTGGEVADEVQEAEHAHELAEGRLENAAQVELLTAIREMSRAEAALNSADTTRALVFERAALAALQRAFDRRRYLLRALSERARIDPARRLAGDRSTARPLTRQSSDPGTNQQGERTRAVLIELGKAIDNPEALDASLASRVLALDPGAEPLKKIVIALTTARDMAARVAAGRAAQGHLLEWMRTRLAARSRSDVVGDPLQGRLADELSGPRGQR